MLLSCSLCWCLELEGLGCNVLAVLQALLKTHMLLVRESSRTTVAPCPMWVFFFSPCLLSLFFLTED